MRFSLTTILASLIPLAFADVEVLTPAVGTAIAPGTVTVTWQDSGTAPALSLLTTCNVFLMVGGNDGSAVALTSVNSVAVSALSAVLTVPATLAGSTANGFFIKVVSIGASGGSVTNYSNRFTFTGMTGITPASAVTAVQALGGATAGPPTENDISNGAAQQGGGAAATAGQGTGFGVPYNLQTGLTKYAPMQPVPPTSITATSYTPLFPTSAYTLATTWVAHPSIATTLTMSQTFSVSSIQNTAAPASMPTGDMAKYLARWKD